MPQAIVPTSKYPDVPPAAGVPAIFRDPTAPVFKTILLLADAATILHFFEGPQWGIFSANGAPVAIPDSVISVDFRREWRIADYPVEQGGFQSYDKVSVPYDARVRLSCAGIATPRVLFLAQVDNAAQSLDLFIVATPDGVYTNVNIIHYDYRRAREGGVGIIQVDVWLQQVRSAGATQFTNTKSPTGTADSNSGPVQPTSPTPVQSSALPTPPIPPAVIPAGPNSPFPSPFLT